MISTTVIPAKAGTQELQGPCAWAPAFAGVTGI